MNVALQGGQTKAREYMRTSRLPILVSFPHMTETSGVDSMGRDISLAVTYMKAIAGIDYAISGGNTYVGVIFYNGTTYVAAQNIQFDMAGATDATSLIANAESAINTYATNNAYTLSEGIFWTYVSATPTVRTFSNPSRSLNTAYQPSTTKDVFLTAAVDITASLSLTTGQTGKVTLQYADDSGFTTNVKTIQVSTNGNTGTLTIGLALGQTVTANVTGIVPAGKYARIATTNVTGTPTFTLQNVQEVTL